jgi:hypothetical protein
MSERQVKSSSQEEQRYVKVVLQRLSITIFLYAAFFVVHEFAHGRLDRLWTVTAQLSSLAVFGFIPLLGAFFLWTKNRRFGGILILGSLPASLVFLLMDRFVSKRLTLPPGEIHPIWDWIFNGSFVIVLLCAAVGAFFAGQLLRKLRAEA